MDEHIGFQLFALYVITAGLLIPGILGVRNKGRHLPPGDLRRMYVHISFAQIAAGLMFLGVLAYPL